MSETTTGPRPDLSPDLTIVSRRVYRGPNVWHYDKAIHLIVDLGSLEDHPSDKVPGFTERLLELLPGLVNHSCSRGHKGGFVERLEEGTWMGHIAEHVALQLQQAVGHDLRRGKTRQVRGERGRYNVIFAFFDENVGLAAGDLAVRLINHLIAAAGAVDPDGFDFAEELERFIVGGERSAFGPSTQAIVDEAVSRDIPWIRLNTGSLVQLGQGVHQERIRATMTSRTPSVAVDIASNKELTLTLLNAAGLPVPKSESVRTADEAVRVAERIGYPVVINPLDGNHGRGVCLDLVDADDVRANFDHAESESRGGLVIVENFITGRDYRCLVIDGKIAAIAERVPAHVIGDGTHTVTELVEITNADPRRGVGHEKVLTRIKIDPAAVELVGAQGLAMNDVPPAAEMVKLALTGNMSTGGISIDRTFEAHPENVEIAEEAARVVGLDIAGIDFIAPDITLPVRETGGGICEVNAAPGFRMHTHPTIGDPQFIAKPVVDMLFPPGTPSRIPIVAVTGTNGKTTTSRMIAHIFKGIGRKVGMTSTDGVVIDERLVIRADASGPRSAKMCCRTRGWTWPCSRWPEAASCVRVWGTSATTSVWSSTCNLIISVCAGSTPSSSWPRSRPSWWKPCPGNGYAVLNADDRLVRRMQRRNSGRTIWFTMSEPGGEIRDMIDDHCRRGGRAVVLEPSDLGDMIVVKEGRRTMQIAWTHLLPATFGGRAVMNVQNAMAAAAAAYAAGASLHDIRQGLRTFTTNYYLAPGRLNEIDVHGRTVIVDYAHNAPGLKMLGDFVDKTAQAMDATSELGKVSRIGVIATAGDRRDSDMRDLGEIAAQHFDVVIVREDENLRGRQRGEVADLIIEGVRAAMAGGARCRQVELVLNELESTRHALARSNPGDLVVICVDKHPAVMAELESYGQQAQAGSRPTDNDSFSVADPDFTALG